MLEGFKSLLTPGPEREAAAVSPTGPGGAGGLSLLDAVRKLGLRVPAGPALLCSPPPLSPKLDNGSEREEFPSAPLSSGGWPTAGFQKASLSTALPATPQHPALFSKRVCVRHRHWPVKEPGKKCSECMQVRASEPFPGNIICLCNYLRKIIQEAQLSSTGSRYQHPPYVPPTPSTSLL